MTAFAKRGTPPSGFQPESDSALHRVVETARRFVAIHDQAAASSAAAAFSPLTFAEGIERDALAFRLERAMRELSKAVRAMDGASSPAVRASAGVSMRSVCERTRRRREPA